MQSIILPITEKLIVALIRVSESDSQYFKGQVAALSFALGQMFGEEPEVVITPAREVCDYYIENHGTDALEAFHARSREIASRQGNNARVIAFISNFIADGRGNLR